MSDSVFEYERLFPVNGMKDLGIPRGKFEVRLSFADDPSRKTVSARVDYDTAANVTYGVKIVGLPVYGETSAQRLISLIRLMKNLQDPIYYQTAKPRRIYRVVRTKGSKTVAHPSRAVLVKNAVQFDLVVFNGTEKFTHASMFRDLSPKDAQMYVTFGKTGLNNKKATVVYNNPESGPPEMFVVNDASELRTSSHRNLHIVSMLPEHVMRLFV